MKAPRLVIAAPSSGCGKTTISVGLMAALADRMTVQGFKVGPDYIDPGYHTAATGRISRNLDTWMVQPDLVQELFTRAQTGADVSIIEGVMGLYDGLDALTENGSTAQLAKLLNVPVILVIDAGSMARSAGALVQGFRDFDPDLNLAGVIANNLAGEVHAQWIKEAVEGIGVPVLGCLFRENALHVPERHLGLYTAGEQQDVTQAFIRAAKQTVGEHIDLDRVLKIAHSAPDMVPDAAVPVHSTPNSPVRIGVARDEAFCFYYEDNFDLLCKAGAELLFFSPLCDANLPPEISGLYLGGGYPELYAAQLAANNALRAEINQVIQTGMPVYAECGGLMALTGFYVDDKDVEYRMIGVIPGSTRLSSRLTMGYREVTALQPNILLDVHETARGHEFHYSEWTRPVETKSYAYGTKSCDGIIQQEGFVSGSLLASYVHLHFTSNPGMAPRFVNTCRKYNRFYKTSSPVMRQGSKETDL